MSPRFPAPADGRLISPGTTGVLTRGRGCARHVVRNIPMFSEVTFASLRERRARYLGGTPKSWLRPLEAKLLEKSD